MFRRFQGWVMRLAEPSTYTHYSEVDWANVQTPWSWAQAKKAYADGCMAMIFDAKYPQEPALISDPRCGSDCGKRVRFCMQSNHYLYVACAKCKVKLKGGLYGIGFENKPSVRASERLFWNSWEIFQRDGARCWQCGARPSQGAILEVDHIIPFCLGGPTVAENAITLCQDCNQEKSGTFNAGFVMSALTYTHSTPQERNSQDPDVPFKCWKRAATFYHAWLSQHKAVKSA